MDKQKSRDILERTETKHLSIAHEIKEEATDVAPAAADKKDSREQEVATAMANKHHQHGKDATGAVKCNGCTKKLDTAPASTPG